MVPETEFPHLSSSDPEKESVNLDASPDVSPEMPIAEPEPEIILPPAEPEVPVDRACA
jgi:hypothetical protein